MSDRGMIRVSLIALALTSCADETISGYLDRSAVWTVTEIDGTAFQASATIAFPSEGVITGQAPCNSVRATQTVPYPWLKIGPIAATRMACPDLDAETAYFDALRAMTLAEAKGDVLLLSTVDGREMVFRTD